MERWRIVKILNNNVVFVKDFHGKEYIAVGNGIGFRHKNHDRLENEEIVKLFTQSENQIKNKLLSTLDEIPFDRFEMATEMVDLAERDLGRKINDSLIINLADHLNFLLQRYRNGMVFPSFASEEIKRFYRDEYTVGCKMVEQINQRYHINLDYDEATTLAFHIINAAEQGSKNALAIMYGVKDIVDLVQQDLQVELDINTLEYSRFIIHLKFFMKRITIHSGETLETSPVMLQKFEAELPEIKKVISHIEKYVDDKYEYQMNVDDKLYLFIHIRRLLNK